MAYVSEWGKKLSVIPVIRAGPKISFRLVKVQICSFVNVIFFEREAKGHLNYRIVKEKVAALNCKQLLLTHFDDEMLNNLDNVSLKCASDGMIIEL